VLRTSHSRRFHMDAARPGWLGKEYHGRRALRAPALHHLRRVSYARSVEWCQLHPRCTSSSLVLPACLAAAAAACCCCCNQTCQVQLPAFVGQGQVPLLTDRDVLEPLISSNDARPLIRHAVHRLPARRSWRDHQLPRRRRAHCCPPPHCPVHDIRA
jgi:hypothetical protein